MCIALLRNVDESTRVHLNVVLFCCGFVRCDTSASDVTVANGSESQGILIGIVVGENTFINSKYS